MVDSRLKTFTTESRIEHVHLLNIVYELLLRLRIIMEQADDTEPEEDAESPEEKLESCRNTKRSVSDKCWIVLFLIIFFIWITSWYYAVYHHNRADLKVDSENITITENETELTQYYFWGNNWIFDTVTCNVAFISAHYETSGWIFIAANVLVSICLIAYSVSSMGNNYVYQSQLNKAYFFLMLLTISLRLLTYFNLNHWKSESIIFIIIQPSHEKVPFWLMPEVVCLTIWYMKRCYRIQNHGYKNLEYHDVLSIFMCVIVPLITVSLAIFCLLFIYSMNIAHKLGWNSLLTYVIVGGSCYIGLTIFYFFSMIISSAIYYSYGRRYTGKFAKFFDYQDYSESFYAIGMVGRYNFGTACYYATLIFPRLHSFFVAKEQQLEKIPHRFYVTQCKLHNLTPMPSGVFGTSHSDSLRNLLNQLADEKLPELKYFQPFSKVFRSSLALIMATNSLTTITLWVYVLDDSRLSLATWAFYIRLMIFLSVPINFLDVAANTILMMTGKPRNMFDHLDEYFRPYRRMQHQEGEDKDEVEN